MQDKDREAGTPGVSGLTVRSHSPGTYVGADTTNLPSIFGGDNPSIYGGEVERYQRQLAEQSAQRPPVDGPGHGSYRGVVGSEDEESSRIGAFKDYAGKAGGEAGKPGDAGPAGPGGNGRTFFESIAGYVEGAVPFPRRRRATSEPHGSGRGVGIPAGLQSLNFDIPARGQVFLFTTPGGDVAVTARAVSKECLAAASAWSWCSWGPWWSCGSAGSRRGDGSAGSAGWTANLARCS